MQHVGAGVHVHVAQLLHADGHVEARGPALDFFGIVGICRRG